MPATRRSFRTRGCALVGVLTAALMMAGCTSDASPDPAPTPTSSPTETQEESVLTFATFGTREEVAAYGDLADAFEQTEPGVRVELSRYPDAAAVVSVVTGERGSVPPPDLFLLDSDHLTRLASADSDALQPLDDLLEERDVQFGDDHQRVALTELSAEASLQCMPAEMSPAVLYANEDLLPSRSTLRSLGVVLPRATETWSWEAFAATARAIATSDSPGGVRGVHLPISLDLMTALVRSAGGDVVDDVFEPSTIDLTSEEALEALSQVAVLAADDSVTLTPAEVERRSALERFVNGQLGMMVGTRSDLPILRASDMPFRVLPLPNLGRARSVSSVTGYCITGATLNEELAADFIAFAVSKQGASILAESGAIVPARLDVASARAFTQPEQLPSNYRVYIDAARRSEPTPFAAEWPQLSARADRLLQRVLTDPSFDLGVALPRRMEQFARESARVLAPEQGSEPAPTETGTPSPDG